MVVKWAVEENQTLPPCRVLAAQSPLTRISYIMHTPIWEVLLQPQMQEKDGKGAAGGTGPEEQEEQDKGAHRRKNPRGCLCV